MPFKFLRTSALACLALMTIGCPPNLAPHLARPQVFAGGKKLGESVFDRYYRDVIRLDRAADAAWAAVRTPEEAAQLKARLRAKMIEAIGGFPERTPLNVRKTGVVRRKGYRIEKTLFESRPRHYVTAHVFLPEGSGFKAPYPALAVACGHNRSAKCAASYQRAGVLGALNGFAVIVYDPIGQGIKTASGVPLGKRRF